MQDLIELNHLSYHYPGSPNHLALNNVSLTIQAGEWISIVGPNGSGKSTLAKTINGLVRPQEGTIKVNGQILTDDTLPTIRQMIGMVFQNPDNQFVGSTVEADIAFGLENLGMPTDQMHERVTSLLQAIDLWPLRHRTPAQLSGGQKQRTAVASAIASRPQVLILDEATSMLDPASRDMILSLVRQVSESQSLTVIAITHNMEEVLLSDRVVLMREGAITTIATPRRLFDNPQLIEEHDLTLPVLEQLRHALAKQSIHIEEPLINTESLKNALWTYNSTM
ncbi:energy-coupling factor transporter ATPase [Aerococcaceae bacterium DSM 111020]|nr:energy-coupling factor transporter ATPase [Aerococcaceae bacterium DSM 111020]